jgi:hypothetical protein
MWQQVGSLGESVPVAGSQASGSASSLLVIDVQDGLDLAVLVNGVAFAVSPRSLVSCFQLCLFVLPHPANQHSPNLPLDTLPCLHNARVRGHIKTLPRPCETLHVPTPLSQH